MKNSVSIVIPNWNGAEKIRKNLPRVLEVAQFNGIKEVIVVDDKSSDESVEILESDFPQVFLIKKKQNSGFSSTVNVGVKNASGEFVFLLNNDAVPEKDFLKSLLRHFINDRVFSVGCNTGGLWTVAEFKNGYFWHNQAKGVHEEERSSAHKTLWVSGGSGIFRKSIWQQLGGLDELFDPFYEEDLDLGYRAIKRGYLNIWEPDSLVDHYKEQGVIAKNFPKSKISKIAQRNQLLFIWKNITSPKLTKEHISRLAKILVTHPSYWPVFLSAAVKLPALLPKRKKEKKESLVFDEEILLQYAPKNR